jgi:PAS domain S-box-containing protein
MPGNSFNRVWVLLVCLSIGFVVGVMLVPGLSDNGKPYIMGIVFILLVAIAVISIKYFFSKQKKTLNTSTDTKDVSKVEFVVDTFQDLVGKLKAKEKELEELKSFAEEKASRIEAYNENVLQSVPSGVISIDISMQIKSINQAAERILGIDAADVLERDFTEVFAEPLTTLMKDHKTISRGEYSYITSDKRHIWLGITSSQLKNAAGEEIGLIFVFTDLTDIKMLQAQVDMKQRLSQLGEMSAGIAHELRNSMSVIAGYANLLSKKVDPASQPTVGSIAAEIQNMDKIISELLAFAKPTALNMSSINVSSIIKESVSSVVGDSDLITVAMNIDTDINVKADEILFRQAVTNIIRNAVEAMPDGGSLEIVLTCRQGRAEIDFKDTGCGIPEDIRQKIFLPFYTTKEKGTGFGLAFVQKIIISHGGIIEVESSEGEGTLFRVILSMAD